MTVQSQTQHAATGVARWVIDSSHSEVGFAVKHMMISTVRGRFGEVSGEIDFDPADPTTVRVRVEVDISSIDTRQEQRDNHLRSADFFDAENHPTMTFVSRKVDAQVGDRYAVTGDLTIRGVTREVVLDTTFEGLHGDPWGGTRAGISATTSINRNDFGLNWNQALEAGGVLVSEAVRISLDIQAVKQA